MTNSDIRHEHRPRAYQGALVRSGATIAANNGATAHQLMAIFGWDTLKMAEAYTRAADQERLAESAMHMLETPEQNGTKLCPTEQPSGTFSEKSSEKSKEKFSGWCRGGHLIHDL